MALLHKKTAANPKIHRRLAACISEQARVEPAQRPQRAF
jgi:hypothetical protein